METSHWLLLLAITGAAFGILVRLLLLISRAWVAGAEDAGTSDISANPAYRHVKWREINILSAVSASPNKPYLGLLRNLKLRGRPWGRIAAERGPVPTLTIQQETIADPVDGTGFLVGEQVFRCSCGTSYHAHSWQWVGEKNGGRCVSCKQVGLVASQAS